jgi:hypothetical protein
VEPKSEPFDERRMGGIPDGITGRVEAGGQVQSDRGTEADGLVDAKTRDQAALDPACLRTRQSRSSGDVREAEISLETRHTKVPSEFGPECTRSFDGDVVLTLTRGHA